MFSFQQKAVDLINTHDTKKKPLFLVVNHLAPHASNEAPDNPLEAPEEEIKKFNYIEDPERRVLAGVTHKFIFFSTSNQILNDS